MLNEQTLEKLYALKLHGMADAFKAQLEQPGLAELSFEERFGCTVDYHWIEKEDCKLKRLLRPPRGMDKSVVMRLSACDWIKRGQNIIITGPTGAGKLTSHVPLTNQACQSGHGALDKRSAKLFQETGAVRTDGS
ncbi:MAG: hypothetical protein CSA33_01335 [Desulfobulbus propionicus]|nr:MAG: hypothetical protein CSA33_01335 [Desulfobulbus propionicus]